MQAFSKVIFLNFFRFSAVGVFLLVTGGYACVDLDIVNQADKPAILKGFSRNYSDLLVTSDMELDPTEQMTLHIFIEYDRFIRYSDELRGKGIVRSGEAKKDHMEFTIGDDDFVLSWDYQPVASLTLTHADLYSARLELISGGEADASRKKYRLTLTNQS